MTFTTCPACAGEFGCPTPARSSKIKGTSIADIYAMQISDLAAWIGGLKEKSVAPLLTALQHTIDSFVEIGLGHLSLDRPAGTLSGGEAQRVKTHPHLGSALLPTSRMSSTSPTIGLHPHDIQRMNDLLLQLRDKGNTVLVVEHKPEVIAIADHVVDLGPGAGSDGGQVVFEGTVEGLRGSETVTGRHLDYWVSLKDEVRSSSGGAGGSQGCRRTTSKRSTLTSLWRALRGHRCRRFRQELADRWLGRRPRRRRGDRPRRDRGSAAGATRRVTPDCST